MGILVEEEEVRIFGVRSFDITVWYLSVRYALSEKIARIAFMHIFAVGESSPRVRHCLYASSLYGVVHTSLICIIFVAVGN